MSKFKDFISALSRGDLKAVRRFYREEYVDKKVRGWNALHLACKVDDQGKIAQYLLAKGWDIEEETVGITHLSGGRPIHIAAYYGRIDTMTMLMEKGCDLYCLTKNKRTPMDLLIETENKECEEKMRSYNDKRKYLQLLYSNHLSKIMDNGSKKTLLDILLSIQDPIIQNAIKSKPVNDQEIKNWISIVRTDVDADSYSLLHECLLFRCIHQKYDDGVYALCTAEIVNIESLFFGPSPLETAVEHGSVYWVKHILDKLIKEDESWTRATDIARNKNFDNMVALITSKRAYNNRRKEKGFSRLHTAVLDNDPDMVGYLLEYKIVDADCNHKIFGTALSMAYGLDNIECAEMMIHHDVNVNTLDRYKQTPLHVAISNRTEDHCDYLVENTRDIEAGDYKYISVLLRAVLNNCEKICKNLCRRMGSNIVKCTSSHLSDVEPDLSNKLITKEDNIFSLCMKYNRTIYPCFMEIIDQRTVDMVDADGNALLHLAAVSLNWDICEELIMRSASVNLINKSGNTPLSELLKMNRNGNMNELVEQMIDTVRVLIVGGATLHHVDCGGCKVLEEVMEYHNERLLLEIINNIECRIYITAQKCAEWILEGFFPLIRKVIPLLDREVLDEFITLELFSQIIIKTDLAFVMYLYDYATPFVKMKVVETLLYKASSIGDETAFQQMINDDVSQESCLDGGESLMTSLIGKNNFEFIQTVLRSKNCHFYLEKKNSDGKIALHVSIELTFWDIVDQIILDTRSVNEEDVNGNTPLSLLFVKVSEADDDRTMIRLLMFIKMLISKSADIYKRNKLDKTCIDYCTRPELKLEIESFFRRQSLEHRTLEVNSKVSSSMGYNFVADIKPICVICEEEPMDCVLNCGHTFCTTCTNKEMHCFICRSQITNRIKMFI